MEMGASKSIEDAILSVGIAVSVKGIMWSANGEFSTQAPGSRKKFKGFPAECTTTKSQISRIAPLLDKRDKHPLIQVAKLCLTAGLSRQGLLASWWRALSMRCVDVVKKQASFLQRRFVPLVVE